jgi:hypothetical protein
MTDLTKSSGPDEQPEQPQRPDETVETTAVFEPAEASAPTDPTGLTDPTVLDPTLPENRASGWHPVSISHLVMSLAFLCLVGAWALVQTDVVTGDDVRWLLPIPWLVAGAAGLIAAAVSGARRHGVRR